MKNNSIRYPLTNTVLDNDDIESGIKVLKSKWITMGRETLKFENTFSKKISNRPSIMVNSGSSANLLIFQCLINPKVNKLKKDDEVLIPAICWSTSLWPIIQSGLKVKFVDIDPKTLNLDLDDFEKKITKKTKALMLVHAMGNCADMEKIVRICKKKKIILIEDTCEALGSKYKGKQLGTFGDFSSYSFFYSHHITSGEGGMVCSKSKKDADVIRTLRSHGWHRAISNKKSNSWSFINSGFNLRPTDISASIGNSQLKKLKKISLIRQQNFKSIRSALLYDKRYSNKFDIIEENINNKIVWFGIPIILKSAEKNYKNRVTNKLNKFGIDTRPLISGNFAKQPAIKLYKLKINSNLKNANFIDKNSFFIGLHNTKTNIKTVDYIKNAFYSSL
ncbi:aminotransferase class V-fold PLP-dependent enzyme [Candidatus Pelagibacter bacterium]|nr:aminotransferase class V-fold PLP-dependent enzyme [Candidatus Pelagibacter bacterium]